MLDPEIGPVMQLGVQAGKLTQEELKNINQNVHESESKKLTDSKVLIWCQRVGS